MMRAQTMVPSGAISSKEVIRSSLVETILTDGLEGHGMSDGNG